MWRVLPPGWFGFIEEVHDGYYAGGGVVYLSSGNAWYGCLRLVNEARDVFDEVVVECFSSGSQSRIWRPV